ncbi:MAG: N-acetylmuramoyl-L-alanine amidase [Thermoleophilia bacterium]|nr:N-acetylmuramoyl-L-alanine amidase [Thermoleophilia bacterium]
MRPLARAAIAAAAAALLCLAVAASTGPAAAAPPAQAQASSASPPASTPWPIPFGAKRKREMADYSERHYGQHRWRLRNPKVIVEHMSQTATAAAVYNTFAPDNPDVELGELPNVCSHYVISPSGRIFRLVNLRTRCRHTVGLNWTAIGIEHAGYGDGDLLGDRRQLRASLRLTQYLRCRFGIRVHDVIGHAESLSSPYHHELVPSLRRQTHGDMAHSSMVVYRQQLRRLGRC